MQINGRNLCDFCFTEIPEGTLCPNCGLTHETYSAEAGLLMPGAVLAGKYVIGKVLGRGGFGTTYLAYSNALNCPVAIKEYLPINIAYRAKGEEKVAIVSEDKKDVFEKGAKRFFDEAKTIARFNTNKNIVSVYEFFYENDTVYYAMEFLSGGDLKKFIAKNGGRLPENAVVEVMKKVCNALMVVHSTQTLHRDIAPDNIYVTDDMEVKLIDFGAAKQVINEEQRNYSVVVKQGFAPAEQYTARGNQGVWTDIYALGATMYYALLGKVPPDAIDRVENPDLEFDPNVPASDMLKAIISKCMATKIDGRYQSVVELLGDLDRINADGGIASAAMGLQYDANNPLITEDRPETPLTLPRSGVTNNGAGPDPIAPTGGGVVGTMPMQPKAPGFFSKPAGKITIIAASVLLVVGLSLGIYFGTSSGGFASGGGGGGGGANGTTLDSDTSCNICASISHTTENHPKCTYCDSVGHTTEGHPKCEVCGKQDHATAKHPFCPTCGSKDHAVHPQPCTICKSTAHTTETHPKCAVCGSTAHTTHPKCATCGSTSHTVHPCATCGSTAHTTANHPAKKKQVTKCATCGSTAHTTANHPKKTTTTQKKTTTTQKQTTTTQKKQTTTTTQKPAASSSSSTTQKPKPAAKPKCAVCGSTAHTSHPKCPTCGSTSHTSHPKCAVCGSTSHTTHPRCSICGSTSHTKHPS